MNDSKRGILLLKIVCFLSLLFIPFALYSEGVGFVIFVFLLALVLYLSVALGNYKLLRLLLLNPLFVLPLFYFCMGVGNYFFGHPKLIYCSYQDIPEYFDSEKEVYIDHWNDDCDWDMLYALTSKVNNLVTQLLMKLGAPSTLHLVFFLLFTLILWVYFIWTH